jgi:hypothetical protein
MPELTPADLCHLYRDHSDIRHEAAAGFADVRYNVAERTSDIRREAAEHTNEIVKEGLKSDSNIRRESADNTCDIIKQGMKGTYDNAMHIKDTRYEIVSRVESNADRLDKSVADATLNVSNRIESNADRLDAHLGRVEATTADRFFAVGRDLSELRMGQVALGKDVELQALKTQLDAKQNTQYLTDKIVNENEKTRVLINELKQADCNRMLIERNAEIVEHRHYGHHWKSLVGQNQWQNLTQQLANQTANFNSQLAETRQGMVNFGTMAGVGQSSTSNNVR